MGKESDTSRSTIQRWKSYFFEATRSRKWLIGASGLFVVALLVFAFQALLFPAKEAHLSFLGDTFPNYELTDGQGMPVSAHTLLDEIGAEEILISFWATWCEPCVRELPMIERALPQLSSKGVDVLLVNYDGGLPEKTRREVVAWLIAERVRFNTFFDFEEKLLTHLHIHGLPFSMRVRTSDKKITWMKLGELTAKDLFL